MLSTKRQTELERTIRRLRQRIFNYEGMQEAKADRLLASLKRRLMDRWDCRQLDNMGSRLNVYYL